MAPTLQQPDAHVWSATELRQLLPHERDAILAAAAKRAVDDYTNDPELTAFDAFGQEELHGTSSNARPR